MGNDGESVSKNYAEYHHSGVRRLTGHIIQLNGGAR